MSQTRKLVISGVLLLAMGGALFSLAAMNRNFAMHSRMIAGVATSSSSGNRDSKGTLAPNLGSSQMSGGRFSLGASAGAMAVSKLMTDLSQAHCYPNPYKPNSTGSQFLASKITFSQLTNHVKIRVYDIAGELVYNTEQDTPNGVLAWDVTNNRGSKLASGVYIYLITDRAGHKAKGKVAVIK